MGRKRVIWAQLFLTCLLIGAPLISTAAGAALTAPQVFLDGITYDVGATLPEVSPGTDLTPPLLRVNELLYTPEPVGDEWVFSNVVVSGSSVAQLGLEHNGVSLRSLEVPVIPAWVSILPPLVAISMALLIRSVLPALMLGLWLGAWALEGLSAEGVVSGLFASFET